ncbi:hypothetical protein B0H17DRAFT_1135107 [Mycena rosella]|uniref:Uncharacterized protein n=1 Tax=Mycena rosella TaxID=1033263 RepID=A0AAD7GHI8_MYCRO|nr:hypothetical protein B0H17DRAFT_1135107 [Mycena rosella]
MSFSMSPFLPVEQALDNFQFGFTFDAQNVFAGSTFSELDALDAPAQPAFCFDAPIAPVRRNSIFRRDSDEPAPALVVQDVDESIEAIFAVLEESCFDLSGAPSLSSSASWGSVDMANTPLAMPVNRSFAVSRENLVRNHHDHHRACDHATVDVKDLLADAKYEPMTVDVEAPDAFEAADAYPESNYDSDMDAEGEDDEGDEDFVPEPRTVPAPRAIRPLPGRRSPKSASSPRTSRSSPAARASTSTPPPSAPVSKKRKAKRSAGPPSSKKAAVAPPTSNDDVPVSVPDHYQYLLTRGSTLLAGGGMRCNINSCDQRTGNFADMDRHHLVHFRPLTWTCHGCASVFARKDSHKRHDVKNRRCPSHFSAERQAAVRVFNALPKVVQMREDAMFEEDGYAQLTKSLRPMFEKFFTAHQA